MRDEQAAERGDAAHGLSQARLVQRRELVDAGGQQEALEAGDTGLVQRLQVVQVARDGATPEADVDGDAPGCCCPLGSQRRHIDGRRDAVERHVDHCRDPARRRGGCGGDEPFPLGAAGLVDVDVTVDQPRQEHAVVGHVEGWGCGLASVTRHPRDAAGLQEHVGGALTLGGDDPARPHQRLATRHADLRRTPGIPARRHRAETSQCQYGEGPSGIRPPDRRRRQVTVQAPPSTVAEFDAADAGAAAMLLEPCCASRRWVAAVVGGRPHGAPAALVAGSDASMHALAWDDVLEALAAHPRIGERATGDGREAAWSRQEQAGAAADLAGRAAAGPADPADPADRADPAAPAEQLREGNLAYEQRFGYVFLICATGLSADQVLAGLRERLGHDPESERAVVRAELAKIVRLRLAKVFQ